MRLEPVLPLGLLGSVSMLALAGCYPQYVRERLVDPLTTAAIIAMTKEETPTSTIIEKIDASGTVYIMDVKDVIDLHDQGVDTAVIDHMMRTRDRAEERRHHSHHYGHPDCYYRGPVGFFGPVFYGW